MSSSVMASASKKNKPAAGNTKRKNVQVVVRTRPMSEAERKANCKNVIACDSVSKHVTLKSITDYKPRVFGVFDKVYGPEATQIQIYADVVRPLTKEVLQGYNCTVFAYGQTGSGKTYTMEGRPDESAKHTWQTDPTAGIIPRALHHIFSELQANGEDSFTVRASYVELYNEQIYDLLSLKDTAQTDSLGIFEDKNKGVSIVGAEEAVVRSRDEVYALLKRGSQKRRTAATQMNMTSSRSHSVFTVTVMLRGATADGKEFVRQGKLNLVDLAGSENVAKSGAKDQRAREAGKINTSLLTLGRVITALTTNAAGHIPYRESKLTHILQESLGGKAITTIIATLSPASSNFDESANTLEYAQRAKCIKNCPEVNENIARQSHLVEVAVRTQLETCLEAERQMHNEQVVELRSKLEAATLEHEDLNRRLIAESESTLRRVREEYDIRISQRDDQIRHLEAQVQACKNDLDSARRLHSNQMEEFRRERQVEMAAYGDEVENRYKTRVDQLEAQQSNLSAKNEQLIRNQEADQQTITELKTKLGEVAFVPEPTPNLQEVFSPKFREILPPLDEEKRLILKIKSTSNQSTKLWQEGDRYCCSLESFLANKENFAKLIGNCQGLEGYSPKEINLSMCGEIKIPASYFDQLIMLAETTKSPENFVGYVMLFWSYVSLPLHFTYNL